MKSLLMSVVATVGIALCALGIASVPAAATPAYQATATPYQNEAIAAAMASYPGGTRISASTVEWGDGAEFISVAPAWKATLSVRQRSPKLFAHWTLRYTT